MNLSASSLREASTFELVPFSLAFSAPLKTPKTLPFLSPSSPRRTMSEEAKPAVKKEEADDDLDGPISALSQKPMKKEPTTPMDEPDDDDVPLALSKARKKTSYILPKAKKVEPEDDDDEKPLKKMVAGKKVSRPRNVKKESLCDSEEEEDEKTEKKGKKMKMKDAGMKVVGKAKKAAASEKDKSGKKEKKVYDLPGQKHDPPEIRDPLRIFYETLYEKVPTSEMAAFWMMEWGLLPPKEAQKLYEKKLRKKLVSPTKVTPVKKSLAISTKKANKTTSKTPTIASKKRKVNDSDDDNNNEDDDDDFIPLRKAGKKKKVSN